MLSRGSAVFLPRAIFVLTLITTVALSACASSGESQRGGGFGYVEMGSHTDPRFFRFDRSGDIATLIPDGKQVFRNHERVHKPTALSNNDHIRTGDRSGARIEFHGGDRPCRIGVFALMHGLLYGDSEQCEHQIETTHGGGQTDADSTRYHYHVTPQYTELTVLSGAVQARSFGSPGGVVRIGPQQEAIITSGAVAGPRPVSPETIRDRLQWREEFSFKRPGRGVGKVLGGAAAGAIILYGVKKLLDKDQDRDDDDGPNGTPPNQLPGDSRTRPPDVRMDRLPDRHPTTDIKRAPRPPDRIEQSPADRSTIY